MLRKLPGFLTACILIIMPLVANAMGFGNIKLNSALNEPLNADIGLLSATVDDVSGLTVKLASPAAFTHAGIDRPAFLTSLKMKIKSRADDTFYIHLTSVQPVREPFLDFLLELSWYNGRILREYTVLLDPPGRIIKQPAVIATPEVTQPARIARAPKPVPVAVVPEALPASEPATKPRPVVSEELPAKKEGVTAPKPTAKKTVSKPESIQSTTEVQPKPENRIKPLVAAATAAGVVATGESSAFSDNGELFPRIPLTSYHDDQTTPASKSMGQGKLDYGITRKGDNLWTVAKKLRVDNKSVSIYQIMMALLKHNPDAFKQGNINRLKIGHVLRIQNSAMLQAMSDSEARAAYRIQTEEWDHYRQNQLVAAAKTPQAIVAGDLGSPAGETEADNSGEVTVAAPGGKELTAGEGLSDTAVSGDVATLKDELNQLRSDADAMGGTDAALNKKIKDMEAELADMQRAISIKDTDLAAVQQMAQKTNRNKNEEKAVTTKAAPEAPVTTEEKTATNKAANETGVAAGAEAKQTQENQEAPPVAQETPASEAKTAVAATPPVETQKPAVQPPAPAVAPAPRPTPEHKAGFMSTVTGVLATIAATFTGMLGPLAGNSLLLFIGLPVLLVLIILMVIVIRRRKQAQGGFQESILSGEASPINGDQAEAKEEESSFLSDFAVSGAGAIQAEDSEVDPLTEADVFMAYGRYEAAEERLTEAMEEDPSRKELKLKLLELYNATKNQSAFESSAEDFYASLGENANTDPMWEKVLSMGKELAPNNPLFTGDVQAPAASAPPAEEAAASVGLSDSQVMDIGLETGVFQTEELEPVQDEPSGLDFSLDLDGLSEPEKTETTETDVALNEPADTDDSGLDFNLDLDSNNTDGADTGTSEPPTTEMEISAETDSELDFDSSLDKDEGEPALVMDSDGLDFAIDADDETSVDLQAEEDTTGLDFNLELDDADAAVQEQSQASPDLEFSLDTNEVSSDTVGETVSDELDHSMAINLDDSDLATAGDGDEDTAIDLKMDDAESPAEDDEIELHDDTLAIDLGESLDLIESLDNDSEDTAADLSLDTEESSDVAILDLAAGGDEVGTKLDLARAYIDMGDPEGARSILDEVLDEGNDEQKQEAQQLIQQIA